MEFNISKNAIQKELGFLQGVVERKNTIPALSNILVESFGENTIRFIGTDLDITLRCETEADIVTSGAMCINARKLYEIVRVLPDATINFKKEENNWVTVKCERSNFRLFGITRDDFPSVPSFGLATVKISAAVLKSFIERTIFATTLEESRYTLSGAKFSVSKKGARMVATDGHRLAYIEKLDSSQSDGDSDIDVLIPRKTLVELSKLASSHDGDIGLGADDNHVYFEVASRLLVSRLLTGQFPNYEMVMPKGHDHSTIFDAVALGHAVRRVSLMADERSHAVRFHFTSGNLHISSQASEEGEALESVSTDYEGVETQIGFNASYLQEFFNVLNGESVAFEFKDGNSQVQLRPLMNDGYDYKYVVMPMRI